MERHSVPSVATEKTRLGARYKSWFGMMYIMPNSQISDRMGPPTFSSIARQPCHEPCSSGIAELGIGSMARRVHPRWSQLPTAVTDGQRCIAEREVSSGPTNGCRTHQNLRQIWVCPTSLNRKCAAWRPQHPLSLTGALVLIKPRLIRALRAVRSSEREPYFTGLMAILSRAWLNPSFIS